VNAKLLNDSQISIPAPPLGRGYRLKRLAGLELVGVILNLLLSLGADPPPIAHQAHGPEQIPLDHQRVEAPNALLRVDPVQHQVVLDRGAQLVRHDRRE
jgi:hypothetical protein